MSKYDTLVEKYPILFKNNTPHFSCSDGWYELIHNLLHILHHSLFRWQDVKEIKQKIIDKGENPLAWIDEYFQENPVNPLEKFSIDQIKEKFGGLRFYISFNNESEVNSEVVAYCRGAIALAESISYGVCETCGAPGSRRQGSWISTLCDSHYDNKNNDE